MIIPKNDAILIINDGNINWRGVSHRELMGHEWHLSASRVYEHIPSGKFYLFEWSEGYTKVQNIRPWTEEDVEVIEVKRIYSIKSEWVPV